jgi:hypothetical protein
VAGHQRHAIEIGHIPGRDDKPPRIRISPELGKDAGNLVDVTAVGRGPGTPLVAVDRSEIAVGISPLVPDADAVLLQEARIGLAAKEPEELVDDGLQVQLLRGQQRKTA